MSKVDSNWSLDALLRNYQPHESWRKWFVEAYEKAMESSSAEIQLSGWKTAAIIFGDMHATVFCLFVCYFGRSLCPPDSSEFFGHINLCLWEMGLATPTHADESAAVAIRDMSQTANFRYDVDSTQDWFAEQLQPFKGSIENAAKYALRLTASRYGMLRGPEKPTITQVLDESLWERVF